MSARRLVTFSSDRDPGVVLDRLRELDPATELVYFGNGRWVLGRVVPNSNRIRRGLAILRTEAMAAHPSLDGLRIGELTRQGFGVIAEYQIQGEPDSRIVEDFRIRDWLFRTDPEGTFQARAAETCGDTKLAAMQQAMVDRVEATAGDAWRWAFKKPVSRTVAANIH
jgi:hypothetical protein